MKAFYTIAYYRKRLLTSDDDKQIMLVSKQGTNQMSTHIRPSYNIKAQYVSSPSYRKEHGLAYKIAANLLLLLMAAAVIIGGVAVN